MKETEEIDFDRDTPSVNPNLPGDRHFTLRWILWKLKFYCNQKKEEITLPPKAHLRDL